MACQHDDIGDDSFCFLRQKRIQMSSELILTPSSDRLDQVAVIYANFV